MKIELRPIDRKNYNECIELSVAEEQKEFVASNIYSLVQAAYEPNLYPLAVYSNSKMVGFFLYDFDEDVGGWSMSRFMIDKSFQGRGIGTKALAKFLDYFKSVQPDAKKLYTSAEVENNNAISMYEKAGFKRGEIFEYESDGNKYREYRMVLSL